MLFFLSSFKVLQNKKSIIAFLELYNIFYNVRKVRLNNLVGNVV